MSAGWRASRSWRSPEHLHVVRAHKMSTATGATFRAKITIVVLLCQMLVSTTGAEPTVLPADAQEGALDEGDRWATYRMLVGTWKGKLDDRFGQGSGQRKYELIFDDQFLIGWHTSVRIPQELSPQGDFHQELSIYSCLLYTSDAADE